MSHVHLGAYETLIDREVDRLARGHWLRPDAALDALTDDARAWLGDRLDELLAVLAPWAGDDALPTALALRVTRSMHEAERIWRDAWEQGAASPGATLRAFERANGALSRDLSARSQKKRRAVGLRAGRATGAANARLDALAVTVEREWTFFVPHDVRPTAMVARHLEWFFAHGDARPSPFGPLLEVWLRGAWPVLLPGAEVLVYVPIEHAGRVETWIEGDPVVLPVELPTTAGLGPQQRPVAAERTTAPPAWWKLGLSCPLTFEVGYSRMEIAGERAVVGDDPPEDIGPDDELLS